MTIKDPFKTPPVTFKVNCPLNEFQGTWPPVSSKKKNRQRQVDYGAHTYARLMVRGDMDDILHSTAQSPYHFQALEQHSSGCGCHILVLLGICTALKEDMKATTAKMVYRITIRLPGEFFNPSPNTMCQKIHMQKIRIFNCTTYNTQGQSCGSSII